ncbi:MAG: lysophospholipid acyltransferase family protein [Patescibacteria group bacterium]
MKVPDVTIENYRPVYEYYEQTEPDAQLLGDLHAKMAKVYHPRVEYAPGARAAIEEHVESGTSLLMASNHIIVTDQFVVGAAMQSEAAFRPLIGDTFIPTKVEFFTNPYRRALLDSLGAVPVFRLGDVSDRNAQAEAAKMLIDVCAKKLTNGSTGFIFPEGTRNRNDPAKLGRIHKGIGRMVCKASEDGVPVSVVPMGLWYGTGLLKHWFRPNLYVGKPIDSPFTNDRTATKSVAESLADCLDMAQQIR